MPNAIDLCLSSTVAADLGVSADATVSRVVTAASRAIAVYCMRRFERLTLTEYPPGYGRPLIVLQHFPIASIASVYEGGSLVDPSGYSITATTGATGSVGDAGMVYRLNAVPWRTTVVQVGNITDTPGYSFGASTDIAVTYTGGYVTPGQNALDSGTYPAVTLPEDIQEAAIMTAVALYRRRGVNPNMSSESIGDWSASYFSTKVEGVHVIPDQARPMLDPYAVIRVV